MAHHDKPIFFHIGLATRDVERAVRFYIGALDFLHYRTVGAETKIEGITGPRARRQPVRFVTRDNFMIELTANGVGETDSPATEGVAGPAGLHHLSFMVADLDACAARIREFGGTADPAKKVDTPDGPMLFCTDPDGVKLEMWERTVPPPPEDPTQPVRPQ